MSEQLRIILADRPKGKASSRSTEALEELQYLMNFNTSITRAMARSIQDLSDCTFVNLANTTLMRRDSYLDSLKPGIKPDTLAALRCAPVHLQSLFPDELLAKAETEIASFETRMSSNSQRRQNRPGHPYRPVGNHGNPNGQGSSQAQGAARQGSFRPANNRPAWRQLGQGQGQATARRPGPRRFNQRPARGHNQSR